jgi:rfaE bifunctional protein nucleotidyltransferase chain/domain
MDTRAKILDREKILARISAHRSRGQRIVFANGCFDLLHAGHIRYLDGARRQGDVLVVGINSDESARPLKGPGRPILPAEARARLVAALRAVNYVTIFDETDVSKLIEDLRPDVHAKGTDYTEDTVPEREVARRLGVRIAIVGDPKRHSTSEMLTKLRRQPNVAAG